MKYLYLDVKPFFPHGVFGRIKKHVLIAKHIWIFLEQWSCTILQTWIFFGYIDMTQNFKDKGKLSRIITHMQKVGHTSEFPFGIYWWTLKNLKNQNFEKKWKKKRKCWRYHFTHVYQKLQSYEVQFMRYEWDTFFLSF